MEKHNKPFINFDKLSYFKNLNKTNYIAFKTKVYDKNHNNLHTKNNL